MMLGDERCWKMVTTPAMKKLEQKTWKERRGDRRRREERWGFGDGAGGTG